MYMCVCVCVCVCVCFLIYVFTPVHKISCLVAREILVP